MNTRRPGVMLQNESCIVSREGGSSCHKFKNRGPLAHVHTVLTATVLTLQTHGGHPAASDVTWQNIARSSRCLRGETVHAAQHGLTSMPADFEKVQGMSGQGRRIRPPPTRPYPTVNIALEGKANK